MSEQTIEGYVKGVSKVEGTRANGEGYVRWDAVLTDQAGSLVQGKDSWTIGWGGEVPAQVDEYVRFQVRPRGKYVNLVTGSLQKVQAPGPAPAVAPAPSQPKAATPAPAKKGGGWKPRAEDPEVAQRIALSTALKGAIDTVRILADNNSLPVAMNKSKEFKYEEIMAIVDKLSVRYYNDITTGRRLTSVQDEGTVKAPAPLPEFNDEIPFNDELPPDPNAS